jgi:hypothetical protein
MPDLPDRSRSRAILIGTSAYRDPAYPPLPAAANSLNGFRNLLLDPRLCGWSPEKITVLQDAVDAPRVIQQLRRLAQDTDDVLLLYFVGHGIVLPAGQLCLTLTDTEDTDPDLTGVEYDRIRDVLLRSPARVKVTILDCCHAGRAIEALSPLASIADTTNTTGVYTLTASDHLARVPPPERQATECTSFTGELIKLIRDGVPGGSDKLTLNVIYSHLKRRLHSAGLPDPNQRGTDTADQFAFSRNAAQDATAPNLPRLYALDIAFCVDTGAAMEPALPRVKEAMLAICRRIAPEMGRYRRPVIRQRVRVITFGQSGQETTPFFSFPEQAHECENAISALTVDGKSSPLAGLTAFREAIHSDWERGQARHAHLVVLFAGSAEVQESAPEAVWDELFETWGYSGSPRTLMDPAGKGLRLFAPDGPPWDRISADFNDTYFMPTLNASAMSALDDDRILEMVASEI